MIKVKAEDFSKEELETTVKTLTELKNAPEQLKEQVTKYFTEFDTDKNGHLDRTEWPEFLHKFFATFKIETPTSEDYIEKAFTDIDINKDNLVQPDELEAFTLHYVNEILPQFEAAVASKWLMIWTIYKNSNNLKDMRNLCDSLPIYYWIWIL